MFLPFREILHLVTTFPAFLTPWVLPFQLFLGFFLLLLYFLFFLDLILNFKTLLQEQSDFRLKVLDPDKWIVLDDFLSVLSDNLIILLHIDVEVLFEVVFFNLPAKLIYIRVVIFFKKLYALFQRCYQLVQTLSLIFLLLRSLLFGLFD